MPGSVLLVVSYVLVAIFVVAFLLRTYRMVKLPIHLRWELAPVPHEKGKSQYGGSYFEEFEWWTRPREKSLVNELIYMFEEIVFLKSVWEHNRRLWLFSFPFHFGLYLLIATAAIFLLGAILELAGVPAADLPGLRTAISAVAAVGYGLGVLGALGLLLSRLTSPSLKPFTTPAVLFNLVLLLAVFASGGCVVLARDDFAAKTLLFVKAMVTAGFSVEIPAVLAVHLVLVFVFLAYLPFSQMMHFVAKYFTYHQVRWDDRPLEPGGRMEKEVVELLKQPVTWSAPHLKADGKKNWVDIVTEETGK